MGTFFPALRIFDEIFEALDRRDVMLPPFPIDSPFPPVDVIIQENTKNLIYRFALAGVPKDNITVHFEGDYMFLTIKGQKENAEDQTYLPDSNERYIKKGIRHSSSKTSYYTPQSKYNVEETKLNMYDGMLQVEIPAKSSAPIKVFTVPQLT